MFYNKIVQGFITEAGGPGQGVLTQVGQPLDTGRYTGGLQGVQGDRYKGIYRGIQTDQARGYSPR